jgi:hypothetical protein
LHYVIFVCTVFDPILPGPDVPDLDAVDGEDHKDGEHEDAHQDRDDHISWICCNIFSL